MYRITKNIFKNERVYIKTESAQKQDWNGTLPTNHSHITTLHKYTCVE